jgi:translation initiation factor 5
MTDTSAEAVAARAAEQLTQATSAMVTQGNIEAELEKERKRQEKEAKKKVGRWAVQLVVGVGERLMVQPLARLVPMKSKPNPKHQTHDPKPKQADEDAAARRAAAAAALATGAKVDPAVAADALRSILAEGGAAAEPALAAALRKLSVEGGLAGKARALIEAMFVDEDGVTDGAAAGLKLATGVKRGAGLLRLVAADAPGQLAVLVALEWLCAVGAPVRIKEAALALKALYDEDLADEDIVLAWADRADAAKALEVGAEGAKAVRRAVAPVVEWLREGEEDSGDESDGEEEEEDEEGSDE